MKSLFAGRSLLGAILLALSFNAGNVFAGATVSWISGGPNSADVENGFQVSSTGEGYVDGDITTEAEYNTPRGICVDSTGNLVILADQSNNVVRVLDLEPGINQTYTLGVYVGINLVTNFCSVPVGVAVDSSENIFILNHGNGKNGNVLEVVNSTGTITTNAMGLTNANGIALDSSDNIYVTDNSNQVLEITAPGISNVVATVTNAGALLQGLVVRHSGMIAVCDSTRDGIYQINPVGGVVTTNAGFHGQGDFSNPGNTAPSNAVAFFQPMGIAETGEGNLLVCDYGNSRVKVVLPSGTVTNLYGVISNDWSGAYPGFQDGTVVIPDNANDVQARLPYGVAFAPDGTVYVTEDYYSIIRHISNTGFSQPPPPAPAAPTGLTATAGYGQITLSWTASFGATSNAVERSLISGSSYTIVGYTTGSKFTDTNDNIMDGTNYYYVVEAVNSTGSSAPSGEASAAPLFSPAPTINSVATNFNQVTLTWSQSQGATSYNVERSQTSGTNYQLVINTSALSYTDNGLVNGVTYYYVIQAVNFGGTNPTNSPQVAATPPLPPVPDPVIGWVTYPLNTAQNAFLSVLNAGSPAGNTFNNDVDLVISNPPGTQIFFNVGDTTQVTNVPDPTPSSTTAPAGYVNNLFKSQVDSSYAINPLVAFSPSGNLMIKAIGEQAGHPNSDVVAALFQYVVGQPQVIGTNAAQFVLTNVTVGASMYYTTDGSYPSSTNPAAVGPITNGEALSLGFPLGVTNLTFESVGYRAYYASSSVYTNNFAASNYVANTITFGFASGQASSKFIASPGQTFYAPVTLTLLSGTLMNQLQFFITVTNAGPNPGPAITPGAFDFQSMLMQPEPNTTPIVYIPIPPYLFDSTNSEIITNNVFYNGTTNFVDLEFTNTAENKLGIGWEERQGMTNLYPTTTQDLIQFSIAHDTLYLGASGQAIVGGYSFQVPVTATSGQTYQIKIGAPSATTDGIGDPGSAVFVLAPITGSLTNGTINAIKYVTMGQLRYIVGDVYPFAWFNAGDFGETNIIAPDVAQVFQSAIYGLNYPPYDPTSGNSIGGYTNVSDFYDAMDSCGSTYVDLGHGYLEKNSTVTDQGAVNALFNGNDQTINQLAFGDGVLNVCDVYVTYRRSLDSSLVWFQRFWTNGVRVAVMVSNTIDSGVRSSGSGKIVSAVTSTNAISITNTPAVNFTSTDYLATAGQTLSIPINASVFGQYPLRVAMLAVSVQPLDGSPPLTTPVSFINGALGSPYTSTNGINTYASVWLNSSIPGISGNGNIGTLMVTIPSNATSMSAYAIHFDHASASPNGLASFTRHTLTGLITLSSRTNSYYNDGIPDSWRLRYFGTIYNYLSVSNADADGTGMQNWQKYQAGLNPTDPSSVLSVATDQVMSTNSQQSVIAWPTVTGKTYILQRSAKLFPASWINVSTNSGDGTYMEFYDSSTNWYRYYRVSAQ